LAAGAGAAAVHCDRLRELEADAGLERLASAERAAEIVRETWRDYEELNLHPTLALEALFIRLHHELAGVAAAT
jgi:hypothetical protein